MKMSPALAVLAALLAGCATRRRRRAVPAAVAATAEPVEVQILAINDFHGNLEPPKIAYRGERARRSARSRFPPAESPISPARPGPCAKGHPYSITVSAGDIIGASPLVSALYLDEPTIDAMNLLGIELNSVGNHEFDKGTRELHADAERRLREIYDQPAALRARTVRRREVQLSRRQCLYAVTARPVSGDGDQATSAPIKIGFIGMTLKGPAQSSRPRGSPG